MASKKKSAKEEVKAPAKPAVVAWRKNDTGGVDGIGYDGSVVSSTVGDKLVQAADDEEVSAEVGEGK
jgi:hypothetical protein